MNIRSFLMAGVASSVLVGCAIHPLPDDVTREATVEIVGKIRCEAREALLSQLIDQLKTHPTNDEIVRKLETDEIDVADFVDQYLANPNIVDIGSQKRINTYGASTIGYRFQLTMTEDNNNSVNARFRDPLTWGLFTLDIEGGNDRQRQNIRDFTFTDNFKDLLRDKELCGGYVDPGQNFIYPITGRVGLYEVVDTFLELSVYQGIDFNAQSTGFVDTIAFQTIFYSTGIPRITLAATTSQKFHLTGVDSDGLTAKRTDRHLLAVTIKLGDPLKVGMSATDTRRAALETLESNRYLSTQDAIADAFRDFLNQ